MLRWRVRCLSRVGGSCGLVVVLSSAGWLLARCSLSLCLFLAASPQETLSRGKFMDYNQNNDA